MEMQDEIMDFKSNERFLCVTLLDSTIRVFKNQYKNFKKSRKFLFALYGHKLPILSMDITTDLTLLISGSADKNLKIWGLDFGDCHKSLYAHEQPIQCVKFIQNTHLMLSASRDGTIKHWDADTYTLIQEFEIGLGPIWSLTISSDGDFFVAGGMLGMSIWSLTQEQIFPKEEQEIRVQNQMEKQIFEETQVSEKAEALFDVIAKFYDSIKNEDEEEIKEVKVPQLEQEISRALNDISVSELEDAIQQLPTSYFQNILQTFQHQEQDPQLVLESIRSILKATKPHNDWIQLLQEIFESVKSKVNEARDVVGYNQIVLKQKLKKKKEEAQYVE